MRGWEVIAGQRIGEGMGSEQVMGIEGARCEETLGQGRGRAYIGGEEDGGHRLIELRHEELLLSPRTRHGTDAVALAGALLDTERRECGAEDGRFGV